jgi:hypothetical protein
LEIARIAGGVQPVHAIAQNIGIEATARGYSSRSRTATHGYSGFCRDTEKARIFHVVARKLTPEALIDSVANAQPPSLIRG